MSTPKLLNSVILLGLGFVAAQPYPDPNSPFPPSEHEQIAAQPYPDPNSPFPPSAQPYPDPNSPFPPSARVV